MKQIALVGTTLSRNRAPYDDPSWAIWSHACAHALRGMPGKRVDRWFEVHTPKVRSEPKTWDPHYPAWLARTDRAEILLQQADPAIPHSVTYPRSDVEAWATARGLLPNGPYFTSTLTWMIALALYEGATTIGIWGCNFAQTAEYRIQRPCAEYWIAAARALGVTVTIDSASPLCKSRHVYGYDGHRKDLKVDAPVTPVPIRVLAAGEAPPVLVIPPEIQALVDQQREMYEL